MFCNNVLAIHSKGLGYIPDWNLQRSYLHGSPHLEREGTYTQMRISIVWLTRWTDSSRSFTQDPIQGHWQDHATKNSGQTRWKLDYIYHETQNTSCCLQLTGDDLTTPCLPLLLFVCLSSFQLLHALVLLAPMLVRPFHESTWFTKPAEPRKTTTTFSPR